MSFWQKPETEELDGTLEIHLNWRNLPFLLVAILGPLFLSILFESLFGKIILWIVSLILYMGLLRFWGACVTAIAVGALPWYIYLEWEEAPIWLAIVAVIVSSIELSFIRHWLGFIREMRKKEGTSRMQLNGANSDNVLNCILEIWITVVNHLISKGVRVHFPESTSILQSSYSLSFLCLSLYHPKLIESSKQEKADFSIEIQNGIRLAMTNTWISTVSEEDLLPAVDSTVSMLSDMSQFNREEFLLDISTSGKEPKKNWHDYIDQVVGKFVTDLSPIIVPGTGVDYDKYNLTERDTHKLIRNVSRKISKLK